MFFFFLAAILLFLFHSVLLFWFTLIHSCELWMSQCSSCIQRVRRSRAFTECGGGRVETTEQRRSLKVRYERDVAEQALSLCYTAGSVTTGCSPAPLPLFLYVPSLLTLSDVILLLPTSSVFLCPSPLLLPLSSQVYRFLFLSLSHFIAFLFLDYCRVNLSFCCLTLLCPFITNTGAETLNWGQWGTIKQSHLIPPSLIPFDALAFSLSRFHVHAPTSPCVRL